MLHILHVERGSFFRKIIKVIAAQSSLIHYEAEGAASAFEILNNEKIELIITGLELSDISGEQFIGQLKKTHFNDIPIMIISSNDSIDIYEKMLSLGVVDFINKKDISLERFNRYIQTMKKENN